MSALKAIHPVAQPFVDAKNAIIQDYECLESIANLKDKLKIELDAAEFNCKLLDQDRYAKMEAYNAAQANFASARHALQHLQEKYYSFLNGLQKLDIFELICQLGSQQREQMYWSAESDFTALVTGDLSKATSPEVKELAKMLEKEQEQK